MNTSAHQHTILMLTLDTREAGLSKELDSLNVQYAMKPLDIGDIAVGDMTDGVPKMIIERKTMSDLYSSIVDGRYSSQKQRLEEYKELHPDTQIAYLLETIDFKKLTKVQKNVVRGVLENTVLRNTFQIIVSYDTTLTASMIKSFVTKISDPKALPGKSAHVTSLTSGAYKPSSKVCVLTNQLAVIPGIGPSIASYFGEQYKTMDRFIKYLKEINDSKTLGDVKVNGRRIGQNKAQTIIDALISSSDDDQVNHVL